MAKKNKKLEVVDKHLQQAEMKDFCTEDMQFFFANTNLMRQYSNLFDGLKPGERRILTMMHKLGLSPGASEVKSAKVVGDVMGNLHPHGDSSIYGTIVRLTQWWNMRFPLIVGSGSFGNQYGGSASAMRYTEVKMSKFAYDAYFSDFSIEDVQTRKSFDGKMDEPEYLPTKYPMALLLGNFAIAQGTQPGMMHFEPKGVFEKAIALIDNPDLDDPLILPDSPTGCLIIDDGLFEEICRTGIGKVRYRGNVEVNKEKGIITINSLPPQTRMKDIKAKILELDKEGKLKGYIDLNEERNELGKKRSRKADMKPAVMHIKFKKEINLDEVVQTLYKLTPLQKTVSNNFILLDNYQEFRYGVLDYMREWLDGRREYKQIRYMKKMVEAYENIHRLETLLMVVDGKNGERALDVIRGTKSNKQIVEYLVKEFDITTLQARSIAKMSIDKFSPESIEDYKKELAESKKLHAKYEKFVTKPRKIDQEIREELVEGLNKYGSDGRRSKIIKIDGDAHIPDSEHIVVITADGYIKKLPSHQGSIGFVEQGDYPLEVTVIRNTEDLMLFDTSGKAFKIPVHQIPDSVLTERGERLLDFVKFNGDITAILPKPSNKNLEALTKKLGDAHGTVSIMMLTRNGLIKKTEASKFSNMRSEITAMNIDPDDKLISVKFLLGEREVIVYTEDGMGVRYDTTEIRETGRSAKGIGAIAKEEGQFVAGMEIVNPDDAFIFCLTSKGYGKKSTLDAFRTMKRLSKPLRIITLDLTDEIKTVKSIQGNEKFQVFMKMEHSEIDCKKVETLPRLTKGKKILGVRRGDHIIDIKKI